MQHYSYNAFLPRLNKIFAAVEYNVKLNLAGEYESEGVSNKKKKDNNNSRDLDLIKANMNSNNILISLNF